MHRNSGIFSQSRSRDPAVKFLSPCSLNCSLWLERKLYMLTLFRATAIMRATTLMRTKASLPSAFGVSSTWVSSSWKEGATNAASNKTAKIHSFMVAPSWFSFREVKIVKENVLLLYYSMRTVLHFIFTAPILITIGSILADDANILLCREFILVCFSLSSFIFFYFLEYWLSLIWR